MTNAMFRKFISSQKQRLHLVDPVFQSPSDNPEAVAAQLSVLATGSLRKVEAHVKNHRDSWLKAGLDRYKELVSSKKVSVKTHGFDPIEDCYQPQWDALTKGRMEKIIADLAVVLAPHRDRVDSLELLVDVSGSMHGMPQQTSFYIATVLIEALGLDHLTIFADGASLFEVPQGQSLDYHHDWLIGCFCAVSGGTNLEVAVEFLHSQNRLDNKTLVVLTDADCDPMSHGHNPFHLALALSATLNVVVWNLKETELSFPYGALDPRVAYVSGHKANLIVPVLGTMLEAGPGASLTPTLVLQTCLTQQDFAYPHGTLKATRVMSEEAKVALVDGAFDNLPKKRNTKAESLGWDDDRDDDLD